MSYNTLNNGLCGLKNIGNTCYMNSIIQILSNCKEIKDYFLNNNNIDIIFEKNKNKEFVEIIQECENQLNFQFGKILNWLWSSNNYICPTEFKKIFGEKIELFQGSEQQDSQEALICIIDTIHNELELPININLHENLEKKYQEIFSDNYECSDIEIKAIKNFLREIKKCSIFKELFQGLQHSKIQCPKCNHSSHTFDPILHLTLSFPEKKTLNDINTNIELKKPINNIQKHIFTDNFLDENNENDNLVKKWYDNFTNKKKKEIDLMSDTSDDDIILYDDLINDDFILDEDDLLGDNKISQDNIDNTKEILESIINTKQIDLTLNDLLKHMIQTEVLDNSNKWHCEKCNEKVNGNKSMNIWYLPEVLVIHLKRFEKTYTSVRKITELIKFPINDLDVSEYIDERSPMKNKNIRYELFAINNHQSFSFTIPPQFLEKMNLEEQLKAKMLCSSGIDFGHYYSYCKNGESWYEYNDEMVKEIKEDELITDMAYLLFYRIKK
jgi:ubiquitin C-terminal hydrolase